MSLRRAVGLGLAAAAVVMTSCLGAGVEETGQGEESPAESKAPPAGTRGDLTIWCWEAAADTLKVVDNDFKEAYPNIKLKYVLFEPTDVYRKIQLAVAAGGGFPDVSCIEDSHLAQFVELGALADISNQVAPFVDKMNAYKWNQASKDGRYYAMPWDSGPVAVFYRRDVFEEAGVDPASIETWEDYYQAAKTIKEETGVPMWPQPTGRNDARVFEMLLWQQGLGYIDADDNVILDEDPRIEETLEFMGRFWEEGLAAGQEWWTDPWYKALANGKVATVVEAVWMGTFLKSFIAPDAEGEWGVFLMPVWEPGDARASNDGGSALAIFEETEQKEAAWAYTRFHLGLEESQLEMYRKLDIFPSLETTYDHPFFDEPDPYFAGDEARALFAEVVTEIPEGGVYSADYQLMNELMATELQKFALGQQSAGEALSNAAETIRARTGRS
jgi:ABC-type glycerol-3-phosphate transport system substrate-binding protein